MERHIQYVAEHWNLRGWQDCDSVTQTQFHYVLAVRWEYFDACFYSE
ncbi:hypothetical protein [Mycobacterium sp. GA-1199]|nr:hypothetical protein [Mycobacterium sp. GA-1199]